MRVLSFLLRPTRHSRRPIRRGLKLAASLREIPSHDDTVVNAYDYSNEEFHTVDSPHQEMSSMIDSESLAIFEPSFIHSFWEGQFPKMPCFPAMYLYNGAER